MKNGNWDQIITKDILKKEYDLGKSWKSIAKKFGCGETTVMRLATKYKISSRIRHYNIIGQKFGKLTVISREKSNSNRSVWLCKCECGKDFTVLGASLRSGRTKTCGCSSFENQWKGYEEISGTYWGRCKASAKNRDIIFDLDIKDAWKKFLDQDRKCALSGRLLLFNKQYLNQRAKIPEWQNASLDRIDSNKGYTLNNIQWVDVSINYMKNDMKEKDFIQFCIDVANYSKI
jgi:hypothetical protein